MSPARDIPTAPRFGTGIAVRDLNRYQAWLETAERAGFDLLTTGDSQSLWAEPFVSMTLAATWTTRPDLAITVSNPMTRHPAVVASACLALQQLSGGRFRYGIASGDSALRNIGTRPARVDELEAYVCAVQALCRGAEAEWGGKRFGVHWHEAPTPVWIAAEGPRTQELAGRIADGVILSNCLAPAMREVALDNIRRGCESVGRRLEELEIWYMCNLVPAASEAAGIESVKAILGGTANHVYRFHMQGKGLPEEIKPKITELKSRYDSRHHASPATAAHNAALVEELGLVEFLAPLGTIAGPPGRLVERLREVVDGGARNLIFSQFVEDELGFMDLLAREVLPAVRG
jgi:alkanesulfonate monooxygenase SsuD/methylene tetrahydromethanopterin reductase-like flavin-dependent oxidoreductase (luciferase family)